MQAVESAKDSVRAGEVYQLVLSQRFSGDCDLDPIAVYRALRLLDPSPYLFLLEFSDTAIVGAGSSRMRSSATTSPRSPWIT